MWPKQVDFLLSCRAEIAQLQQGAERQRKKRLHTVGVVGITCCACLQDTLAGKDLQVLQLGRYPLGFCQHHLSNRDGA